MARRALRLWVGFRPPMLNFKSLPHLEAVPATDARRAAHQAHAARRRRRLAADQREPALALREGIDQAEDMKDVEILRRCEIQIGRIV